MLNALYATVARARRRAWSLPGRQRRLERPVVSVGNLRVGGTGKTPVVAAIARLLQELGERPAVLSRGYARRRPVDGVVVVADCRGVRADLDRAGDEPLMLARVLDGVPVLVSADRYVAGRLAERRLGCTVHVLDDGFQHLPLARTVDLVIVSDEDVRDGRTLPGGRLREPLAAARAAHALLVPDADEAGARDLAWRLGVAEGFALVRRTGAPRRLDTIREWAPLEPGAAAFAVAGIARPERFFSDLEAAGIRVAGTRAFPDHHPYDARDVRAITAAAAAAGATVVMTTEKDLVRLLPFRPFPMPLAWLPLSVSVEPAPAFRAWLAARVAPAAAAGSAA
jgi:tetraacyldisaccharide 4'-kinase